MSFYITNGYARMMTAGDVILGICREAVASTDTKYAATTPIEVEHLTQGDEVYCPISAGTIAATERGEEADVVTGGLSLTLTESNNDFRIFALDGSSTTYLYATPIPGKTVF